VVAEDIGARVGLGILAPALAQKCADPPGEIALFTVSGYFAPSGTVRKSRLVEFTDDPGP
jgi:hypothetical protein